MPLKTSNPKLKTSLNHHAYLISGDRINTVLELEKKLESELGFEIKNNLDYVRFDSVQLTIDNARDLKEMHTSSAIGSPRPSGAASRIFLISFDSITREAENSLLKMFEEPNPSSRFFVVTPSAFSLLPTLRSRFEILTIKSENAKKNISLTPQNFVKMTLSERFKEIKKITEDVAEEKIAKQDVILFLQNLAEFIKTKIIAEKGANPRVFSSVLLALNYATAISSSLKMLLENVAISFE